jgi:hypothetical protein
MSGLVDKVEGMAENKLGQDAQPGDSIERTADNDVNQGTFLVVSESWTSRTTHLLSRRSGPGCQRHRSPTAG